MSRPSLKGSVLAGPVLVCAVLAAALGLAGCSSATPQSSTPISYPPVASGSTDPKTGAVADGLIAKVVDPPSNTRQVEKAPDPLFTKPISTLGCGAAQRTVFWIADHWTQKSLTSWLTKHPVDGLLDDPAAAVIIPRSTGASAPTFVVQRATGPSGAAATQRILFELVTLDDGTIGVRVQAEVGPSTPCSHTQDSTGTN